MWQRKVIAWLRNLGEGIVEIGLALIAPLPLPAIWLIGATVLSGMSTWAAIDPLVRRWLAGSAALLGVTMFLTALGLLCYWATTRECYLGCVWGFPLNAWAFFGLVAGLHGLYSAAHLWGAAAHAWTLVLVVGGSLLGVALVAAIVVSVLIWRAQQEDREVWG